MEDTDYQRAADAASATWHAFYDAGSGVRRYVWCVGTASDAGLCDAVPWTDVGLMTSARAQISSPVTEGSVLVASFPVRLLA